VKPNTQSAPGVSPRGSSSGTPIAARQPNCGLELWDPPMGVRAPKASNIDDTPFIGP